MNTAPLLSVVTDQLEPMFNKLRQAGISEEAAATIIGNMAQNVLLDTTQKFEDVGLFEGEVFENLLKDVPEDEMVPKMAQFFQEKTGQDLYEFVKAKVDALNAEFDAAGND